MRKIAFSLIVWLILSASVFAETTPLYIYKGTVICRDFTDGSIPNSKVPIGADSVFTQGDDVLALGEFINVVGKHRFKVEKYLNGIFYSEYTTGWKNPEEKWVWDYSYFVHPQPNARPGRWKWIIFFGDREGGFEQGDEKNFKVIRTDPPYTFTGAVACLSIADGEIKNSKVPVGVDSVFTAGDTVRGLVELIKVYVRHRFGVVTLFNGRYWSEYTSDWREVGFGWDYSHFTPELKNARVGDWEFLIYLESEGHLDFLANIKFGVKEAEPTAVEYNEVEPLRFSLHQNYPNPFNPATTISFNLIFGDDTCLEILNLSGQKVATLLDGYCEAGRHEVYWNATGFSAGVYFARLQSGDFTATKKMTLLK
ncbi:MAG: T9SS type A sorting domain-containing protein [Patescibacteria group bacterium]|nr:T9SS type A sorting domain-containing protein [Patescibacteria group bacterium]